MFKHKSISIILGLGILLFIISGCSQSGAKDGANQVYEDSENSQWYVMVAEEDSSEEMVLVSMKQEENIGKTALGEFDFNGYLNLTDVKIVDESDNPVSSDEIKEGQKLMVDLSNQAVMTNSLPPQIPGMSIQSVVLVQ